MDFGAIGRGPEVANSEVLGCLGGCCCRIADPLVSARLRSLPRFTFYRESANPPMRSAIKELREQTRYRQIMPLFQEELTRRYGYFELRSCFLFESHITHLANWRRPSSGTS